MSSMQVTPVDERDSSWEDDAPRFRVYLPIRETDRAPWDLPSPYGDDR